MERGFILHPTYRIEQGRPVVHLFGVTDQGESFVVRDTRVRPSFFLRDDELPAARAIIREADASLGAPGGEGASLGAPGGEGASVGAPGGEGASVGAPGGEDASVGAPGGEDASVGAPREAGVSGSGSSAHGTAERPEATPWRTMAGERATEIFVDVPPDVPPLRDRLQAAGLDCLEADVPFVTRYLYDRGLRSAVVLHGSWRAGRRIDRIYEDIDLVPVDHEPQLRVLSVDIETDPKAERIYSFALYAHLPRGGRVAEVHYRVDPAHRDAPGSVDQGNASGLCYDHPDEARLLHTLVRRVREIDPDVLTGWNVVDFDLAVLERAFARHKIPFHLGRADLQCRIQVRTGAWGTSRATVPGRVVVDGLDLVRSAFIRLDSYSLESAAQTLLGEGKMLSEGDRGEAIQRIYREDLSHFLAYNLADARLVIEIIESRDLMHLAVTRSLLTGLPLDRVAGSIAAFDFLYIGELHRRGLVAPSVRGAADREAPEQPQAIGGHVLESQPGIYDNVWLFDYRSLYPSIIRTFFIDPLGHQLARGEHDETRLLTAPNGAVFLRERGILPDILTELFPRRERARDRGEHVVATAIKILMNSFYGVLATPRCRFFSTEVSNAITTFGQRILLWTRDRLEAMGYPVIYGDTDSVFAVSGISDAAEAERMGATVVGRLNEALGAWIAETYEVPSHLMLEFERLYVRFFMPRLRHRPGGSKKRYAGIVGRGSRRELVFTGLESVRRDWTLLAKDFQRHLLQRVFDQQEIEPFIVEFVRELREGQRDGDLVYRKALRKPLEAYGKTTPPHVRAARLLPGRPGRVIAYVMTTEGPQPVGHVTAPLDYRHYIDKQLRPIADAILVHIGRSFEEICGSDGQLGLL